MKFIIIAGKVKQGRKVGAKLGFRTINVSVPKVIKKTQWGIYFSLIKIGDKIYPGVTHLGSAKTFQLSRATCETHLLTLKNNLYNKKVEKKLIFKIRDIEEFNTVAKLKNQIKKDVKAAKKFFGL